MFVFNCTRLLSVHYLLMLDWHIFIDRYQQIYQQSGLAYEDLQIGVSVNGMCLYVDRTLGWQYKKVCLFSGYGVAETRVQ